jgi:hypothetical protein
MSRGRTSPFIGIPDTLPAGLTAFSYENIGTVGHEMGVDQLMPGVTMMDIDSAKARKTPHDSLYDGDVGVLATGPGKTTLGRLLIDLKPGRGYLFWCDFRNGPDQPSHSKMGMIKYVTVR